MTGEDTFTGDRVIPFRVTGRFARSDARSERLVRVGAKRTALSTIEGYGRGVWTSCARSGQAWIPTNRELAHAQKRQQRSGIDAAKHPSEVVQHDAEPARFRRISADL